MLTKQEHADALLAAIWANVKELKKHRDHLDAKWLGEIIDELEKLSQ